MVFYMNEDYNYIIDGDIEIINEMKSKEQYAWDKWKKHYNFKPYKTDKTGRVGTIEVDGRTIKVDMRKDKYDKKTVNIWNDIKENIKVNKKDSNKGTYINPKTRERKEIDMAELKKYADLDSERAASAHLRLNRRTGNVSRSIYGDKNTFKRSFKDAKMTTDHEIGHVIDNEHENNLDKKGKYNQDFDAFRVGLGKELARNDYAINAMKKGYDKSHEVEHANPEEGIADRYSANKNGQKEMRHHLKSIYKRNKKEKDKLNANENKADQIDMDTRRKMLNDPELAKYKLDDEKRDYGKGIKKRFDAQNVSKKHRNMNQEAQEKKKKKFNKE